MTLLLKKIPKASFHLYSKCEKLRLVLKSPTILLPSSFPALYLKSRYIFLSSLTLYLNFYFFPTQLFATSHDTFPVCVLSLSSLSIFMYGLSIHISWPKPNGISKKFCLNFSSLLKSRGKDHVFYS